MRETNGVARTVLMWLVPFAVVAAVLGVETDWGRRVDGAATPATAPTAQPVSVALLPEYRIDGGVEARKETVDRVLFNPTRRPAPPAIESASAQSTMKRGQYTLTGTTMVGSVATAFLKEVNGGKSRSVRKGDTLDGMLVADVAPDRVRLKQGSDFEDLPLKVALGPKTTVQPVIAPPPPVAAAPGAQPTVQPAAGGTQPAVRPAVPPAAPGPVVPNAAPRSDTANRSINELLAERRRAARAAAEAASAARQNVAPQR